jgi:type I restriction enzyme M protein
MLDVATRRRIDTARDILVGKVPDPKSQVEQITIALIYKFMDDMDADSEEMGGERKFFSGEFGRYGWAKLMHSGLAGHETLNLYAEAISKMPENPGIPPLFRDIFKNAYLPYRDPETLRAFLKIIDDFEYDHSERLGDAFEYLLSVLGSQGDAGQFRTPRHIIDFVVRIVDPKKNETVLDPACGTAGFLISSYKHILKTNTDADGQSTLTPEERGRLAANFTGYDISPDMVRLSLANMYLHGFADPHIYEYDTLTSLDRWNEHADVIVANPPFMSPTGGIKPHNRFGVQSKRSEVLFVDYMAEHLTPNGRAGIIVPEGMIFQSQSAYKQLRKMLVEEYLVAVISLPAGVFQPYSGVKTSILVLDKALARKSQGILFLKIMNDGTDLGARRKSVSDSDLPQAVDTYHQWAAPASDGTALEYVATPIGCSGMAITRRRIAADGDYNLTAERYRGPSSETSSAFPMTAIGQLVSETTARVKDDPLPVWSVSNELGLVESRTYFDKQVSSDDISNYKVVPPHHFAYNPSRINVGSIALNRTNRSGAVSPMYVVFSVSSADLNEEYLFAVLKSDLFAREIRRVAQGAVRTQLRFKDLTSLSIPLPPLDAQKEIVAEIEGYQKVIDGARAVVENYRPQIDVDPKWPIVLLGDVCVIQRGKFSVRPRNDPRYYGGQYPFIQTGDIVRAKEGRIPFSQTLNEAGLLVSKLFSPPLVVITIAANIGDTAVLDFPACFPDSVVGLTPKEGVDARFLQLIMRTKKESLTRIAPQAAQKNINIEILKTVEVPLPSSAEQRAIVDQIEAEKSLVASSGELIQRFEKKIRATLACVWGDDELGATEE